MIERLKGGVLASVGAAALLAGMPGHAQPASSEATLAFNPRNVARVRTLIKSDAAAATRWKAQLSTADAAVAKAPSAPRFASRTVEALALTYRVTGDRRYAVAARDMLAAQAGKSDWLSDMPLARRSPRWNSDLKMGETVASFGIAYDAIRDTLTPAERKSLVAGLVRGGILPILGDWVDGNQRIHTLDTMGHNWWAHIVFSGGVGVLAILRDEPRAKDWATRIDQAGAEWMRFSGSAFETKPPTFGLDGAYSETIGYADLALHALLLFRRSWIEAMPTSPAPITGLDKVADYFFASAYPRSTGGWTSLHIGDSREAACGCGTLADLWALGDHNPAYLRYMEGFAVVPEKDAWSTAVNLPYFPEASARLAAEGALAKLPMDWVFRSQGLATWRQSWSPDSTMLSLKSGYTWNHNHADAGSFTLHHRGKDLLIDSGHSAYSTPEYDGYFRQSVAHNVVTIDGNAVPPSDTYDGSHTMGTIDHAISAPGFRYIWADATGPTARNFQRNFRNLMWVGDTILVIDDVRSWEIGQFEWLLHFNGTARRNGQTMRITQGDADVDVRPLFPQPFPDAGLPTDYPEALRVVERAAPKDPDPKVGTTYFAFQPTGKSDREKFIVAVQPVEPGRTSARLERFEGVNWIAVRITDDQRVTEVYLNLLADGRIRHRNANATLGGYDTDAYILALSWKVGAPRGTAPDSFFVADGSYVRKGGSVLLDSLSKVFAHVDLPSGRIEISRQVDGSVRLACERPISEAGVQVACSRGIATLRPR